MTLLRRQFLRLAGGVTALPVISQFARADTFPDRPVHIVIGFAPGGVSDVAARLISQSLQRRLGLDNYFNSKACDWIEKGARPATLPFAGDGGYVTPLPSAS